MIKFRAYCENCKKYTYFNDNDHHYHNYYGILSAFCSNGDNDFGDFEYELNNLEQFTGQKDKHGKDIYVGDIVYYERDEANFVIGYDKTISSISICNGDVCYTFDNLYGKDLEIIGNINENKELEK